MELEKYLPSDARISSDTGRFPNLEKCAEAWNRYQNDPGFIQNVVAFLYGTFNTESRFQRDQVRYYHNDKQVDTYFEAENSGGYTSNFKTESLPNSTYKNSSELAEKLKSQLFHESLNSSVSTSLPDSLAEEVDYGLEALSGRWQIYLAVLYTLTAVTSFVMNIVTVIVLSRGRKSELKKYLINLSVSDLLMSMFSIPFTYTEYMLGRWVFAGFLCPVVRLTVTLAVFVSVATMTVIGMNRYLAIMHPLKAKKSLKFRHWTFGKNHVILVIWLVGIAISLPEFLMHRVEPFCFYKRLLWSCKETWPESVSSMYSVIIYLCTFVIPLSLLSYLYTNIGLKLWRRKMPGNLDVNRDLTMQNQRVKAIKMLFMVVIMFVIMWLPLQTFSLVVFLFPDSRCCYKYQSPKYIIFVGTYFTCHWLSMAHSCLNPLIYCFMNDNFRTDLQALICWRQESKRSSSSFKSTNICSQGGQALMAAPAAAAAPPPAPAIVTSHNNNNNTSNSTGVDAAPELRFHEGSSSSSANKDQPIKVDVQVEMNFNQAGKFLVRPTTANTQNSITTIITRCDGSEIPQFTHEELDGTTGHLIELASEGSSWCSRWTCKPTGCTSLVALCSLNSNAKKRSSSEEEEEEERARCAAKRAAVETSSSSNLQEDLRSSGQTL